MLATAGDLVFQGNGTGEFVAYGADNGSKLWAFPAQTGIIAAPMTYAIDGEQYVAVLAGWGGGVGHRARPARAKVGLPAQHQPRCWCSSSAAPPSCRRRRP